MNLQFGSNFGDGTGLHELTGEPYLSVTHYAPGIGFRHSKNRVVRWLLWKDLTDERGRKAYRPRKLTNAPFQWAYRTRRKLRPFLCNLDIHDRADITEIDGSTWRAGCNGCKRLLPARKPHPVDPERVIELKRFDEMAEKYERDRDAYEAGEGPCPDCKYPDGQHELACWMAD